MGKWCNTDVAVKVYYEVHVNERTIPLLQQEISVWSKAHHPNIVSICGVTVVKDRPLQVIMELMEGSLTDVIAAAHNSGRYLTLREQLDMATGCLDAIVYLHQMKPRPLLHGDIRPNNVLVSTVMVAKLGDQGTAHFVDALEAGPVSPEYQAPERMPKNGISPRNTTKNDIYSVGATLAELFTGRKAITDDRPNQVKSISNHDLQQICLQMTMPDPSNRPTAQQCMESNEAARKQDVYKGCLPKRMVKGFPSTGDHSF